MGRTWPRASFATLLFGVGLILLLFPRAPAQAAAHNMNGWAWSGTTGWVSFNCNDPKPGFPGGDCASAGGDYGVDIIDTAGNMQGWAWSQMAGWICFGATCTPANSPAAGTPTDDHYCPGHNPCARYEPSDEEIHGWAFIIGDNVAPFRGWISLNCTDVTPNTALPRNCGLGDYNGEFDESTGRFSGFAWNGNGDSTGSGWMQLACAAVRPCAPAGAGDWGVTTTWVMTGWLSMDQQEGIYTNSPAPTTGTHLTAIPLVFQDFSAPAGSTLRCFFRTSDSTTIIHDVAIPASLSRVTYTSTPYTIAPGAASADALGNPILWSFSTAPGYAGTPPAYGCEVTGTSGIKKQVPNLVAVHPPGWTFTGPGGPTSSDSNRAKFCLDGNLGSDPARGYFQNIVQCDTEGDLAYTLLKAKGIKVEVRCSDDVDDDANFQKDCAGGIPVSDPDRSCRGITYLCIVHPAVPPGGSPAP